MVSRHAQPSLLTAGGSSWRAAHQPTLDAPHLRDARHRPWREPGRWRARSWDTRTSTRPLPSTSTSRSRGACRSPKDWVTRLEPRGLLPVAYLANRRRQKCADSRPHLKQVDLVRIRIVLRRCPTAAAPRGPEEPGFPSVVARRRLPGALVSAGMHAGAPLRPCLRLPAAAGRILRTEGLRCARSGTAAQRAFRARNRKARWPNTLLTG